MQAIRLPKMGQTMESGTVTEWHLAKGDSVAEGDIVATIESEKTALDLEADQAGELARIDVEEGKEIPPGTIIGIVLGPDESLDDAPAPRSEEDMDEADGEGVEETPDAANDEEAETDAEPETADAAEAAEADAATEPAAESDPASSTHWIASPSTRRLARELGVSIESLDGTGTGGRITRRDVLDVAGRTDEGAASNAAEPTASAPETGGAGRVDATRQLQTDGVTVTERRELAGVRKTIARRMSESHTSAPHVTLNREVAVDRALAVAEELSTEGETTVGFNDLLVVASAQALEAHPEFNAWFDNETLHLVSEVNVATAIDADAGLLTPVIRDVSTRTIEDVAWERRRVTASVLEGTHTMDDLQGGTFTITNLGTFAVDSFDPIINPPQVAILGVGRFTDDGARCTLSLSFDHRVVDGADAARFLETIVQGIKSPSKLVTDQTRNALGGRAARPPMSHHPPADDVAAAGTDDGGAVDAAASNGQAAGVEGELAARIQSEMPEIAADHGWDVSNYSVDLTSADGIAINIEATGDISEATLHRLSLAASRRVGHEYSIDELFDPAVSVSVAD